MPKAISPWTSTEYPTHGPKLLPPTSIIYEPLKLPVVAEEKYDDKGKRYYVHTATGQRCASISTLLGATDKEGQKALAEWRDRIGHDEAAKITNKSADTGDWWHNFCEDYVSRKPVWKYVNDPEKLRKGASIAATLNSKIKRVIGTELRVADIKLTDRLGVAGRFDLLAELHDGRRAVVDFKTARWKPKDGNRLNNYAYQASFYAKAVNQVIDPGVDVIIIFQLTPTVNLWQESAPDIWVDRLVERVNMYADLLAQAAEPTNDQG